MSITLSIASRPSSPAIAPGLRRAPCKLFAPALACNRSFTSVLLPDPETPVTQIRVPRGKPASIPRRLCSVAPRTHSVSPFPARRWDGIGIALRPLRYAPVIDPSCSMIAEGGPAATTLPPASPATRSHIDDVVGCPHGRFRRVRTISHRVAEIAEDA